MRVEARRLFPALLAAAALAGCTEPGPAPIVGTLEWDRIAVTAELAEPVLQLGRGRRRSRRGRCRDSRARRAPPGRAHRRGASAARRDGSAVGRGSRTARASRRSTRRARTSRAPARRRRTPRPSTRASPSCASASSWPSPSSTRRSPRATNAAPRRKPPRRSYASSRGHAARADRARRRPPSAATRAALDTLKLTRERLTVRAPRAGRIDALPFRAGDQPPVGAELVSMLVGDAPYARVFVPAPQRAQLKIGARFEVRVEGVATPFPAHAAQHPQRAELHAVLRARRRRREPARLPRRAACSTAARELPAGLPVTAVPLAP